MNTKWGFVVLHYNTIDETNLCVESIRENCIGSDYEVIVVDNASPNKTGLNLKEKYEKIDNINVILLDENIGFANGNNIGVNRAKECGCDFVCCLNNDVLLLDSKFCEKMEEAYAEYGSAIIGPRIILNHGTIQNIRGPLKQKEDYIEELRWLNKEYSYLIENNRFYISFKDRIKDIIPNSILNWWKNIKHKNENKTIIENIVLHGCCVVFTPSFLKKCSGFDSRTFLYHEEELLFLMAKKNNLKTLYWPIVEVRHLEDAATNSMFDNSVEKMKFVWKYQIDSVKIVIEEMSK